MIVVYLSLLILLGVARFLVARRAARLEKKFVRVALAAQEVAKQPGYKEGNSSKSDPFKVAKSQFLLGQLVQKRDRVEARYAAWQALSEKLGRVAGGLCGWRGRFVPYLFGAVDAVLLIGLVGLFVPGDPLQIRQLVEAVAPH